MKSKLKTILKMMKSNKKEILYALFRNLTHIGLTKWINDKYYLKIAYFLALDTKLDLENPKSFNQKLQWLKLNDRKPKYVNMVDKYKVREYIKDKIGEVYLIPLYGVWNSFDEIDFNKLPNQFVLKCNHDSGSVIVCKDKNQFDMGAARRKLNKALKTNGYWFGREWPYKEVKPHIIAEKYLEENSKSELRDYKFMCFNGEYKCAFICTERFSKTGLKVTIFDRNWNRMPFGRDHPASAVKIPKPKNYEKMIELAEILAKDIPFVRIDFYEVNNKLYFGEITLYPGSGLENFRPKEWDYTLGNWIQLPIENVRK